MILPLAAYFHVHVIAITLTVRIILFINLAYILMMLRTNASFIVPCIIGDISFSAALLLAHPINDGGQYRTKRMCIYFLPIPSHAMNELYSAHN
jgi:hypothetical protein